MDSTQGCLVNNGGSPACTGDLVEDILPDFRIGEPGEIIVDGDALAQRLMDGFSECIVQMGLPTEYESKAVEGIIAVIHEHFDILQDAGREVLCLIDGKEEGLLFFPVEVEDLLLDRPEHAGFAPSGLYAKRTAELTVEFHDADGREAEILHVVKVGVQVSGKTAQRKGFAHAGTCGEQADSPGILEVVQPREHLRDVFREETVLLGGSLFVKGVEGQPIVSAEHQHAPPILE